MVEFKNSYHFIKIRAIKTEMIQPSLLGWQCSLVSDMLENKKTQSNYNLLPKMASGGDTSFISLFDLS